MGNPAGRSGFLRADGRQFPGHPEPINLAEHRIRRKHVLRGLTHEYYVAALLPIPVRNNARHQPNRISEPLRLGPKHTVDGTRNLTEAMVAIEGERMRGVTWCVVEEVKSGD